MRTRLLLLATALVVGVTAPAEAAPRSPGFPEVLRPSAVAQFPEGVAWDPTRQALLVGSLGTVVGGRPAVISAVGRDEVARTVVSDDEMPAFLGLKVDARHRRIVAVFGVPGGPGGLAVYDLRTGEREWVVGLSGSPNDVALDPRGVAYVSDTDGAIYRVSRDGTASTVVSDPRLGPTLGANGLVWHRGGLLVVHYTTGRLFRVDHGRVSELRLREPLVGADGIDLRRDGTLVVVTNSLVAPGRAAVHELVVGRDSATAYRVTAWPDPSPTTVAATPFGAYVLDGHLDALFGGGGGPVTDFVLRRV
jgi:sugar lactone lactonase YvrE